MAFGNPYAVAHVVTQLAGACAWLAQTFYGLTWKRFGMFCLLVEFIALNHGPSIYAIAELFPALQSGRFPWMPVGALGLAKGFFHEFLAFAPVLLAVIAVENRGPRAGNDADSMAMRRRGRRPDHRHVPPRRCNPLSLPRRFHEVRGLERPRPKVARFRRNGDPVSRLQYDGGRLLLLSQARHRDSRGATSGTSRARRIERENAEARLQVMQAQIEPHFLFNTLASVRRLYEVDRASGRAMLRHLSRYLTASLPGMREPRPTLARELALALAYLNVQKIRMESRLTFDVEVPKALEAAIVPPMMLATLVENAVIHGLSPLSSGGHIRISAHAELDKLLLEVADNGRGLQETWGGGVGLANIRTRLNSAFGSSAYLTLTQGRHGGVTATIALPLATIGEAKAA